MTALTQYGHTDYLVSDNEIRNRKPTFIWKCNQF